ncbi:isopentenyl-diphosphate Delta-isomerase [Micromonospora sp. DR5-3]|uniref:isopentenyl-diphosphate Delta-isomerase n=1 Tax=unclassified Micromonospora TaxID=2617518 RepID=UPI0011DB8C85|nr:MULTISPECIES: isopentenyl-diphosphate Delta-isomerase [unclassified Micromonospora]MCW3813604.1 isopentenyl-diphosphate Delta-isomerase [Micromonospora sp. DR5-3]TYC25696.1 isopentenyl-diphosphate Delta-isomerase [Micromonospora sp. MP36]
MRSREEHLVELVDDAGHVLGEATVAAAHQAPGRLHRAFSVLLVDPDGRILLQQRAAVKTRFPLRWANSCCGHPLPGQSLAAAANRRLAEELGVGPVDLIEVGVYVYYAEDPATGRVEFEYDHVLRADVPADLPTRPDPDEVASLRWVDPGELTADLDVDPRAYSPWLGGVVSRLLRPAPTAADPAGTAPSGGPAEQAPERPGGR